MAGVVNLDDILSEIHALDSEERVLLDRLFAIMEQRSILCNILENSVTRLDPTSEVSVDVQSTSRHSKNLPHDQRLRQPPSHQPVVCIFLRLLHDTYRLWCPLETGLL